MRSAINMQFVRPRIFLPAQTSAGRRVRMPASGAGKSRKKTHATHRRQRGGEQLHSGKMLTAKGFVVLFTRYSLTVHHKQLIQKYFLTITALRESLILFFDRTRVDRRTESRERRKSGEKPRDKSGSNRRTVRCSWCAWLPAKNTGNGANGGAWLTDSPAPGRTGAEMRTGDAAAGGDEKPLPSRVRICGKFRPAEETQ